MSHNIYITTKRTEQETWGMRGIKEAIRRHLSPSLFLARAHSLPSNSIYRWMRTFSRTIFNGSFFFLLSQIHLAVMNGDGARICLYVCTLYSICYTYTVCCWCLLTSTISFRAKCLRCLTPTEIKSHYRRCSVGSCTVNVSRELKAGHILFEYWSKWFVE